MTARTEGQGGTPATGEQAGARTPAPEDLFI
jgi:hypothetical protein